MTELSPPSAALASEAIARELEALGEEPLSADELAMLAADALDEEPAVASTARLIELSQPYAAPELTELGAERVWRTIEGRRAPQARALARPAPSRRWVPWVAVSLAIAAALVLVVVIPSDDDDSGERNDPSNEQVAVIGDQARSALRALDDGLSDTARAERLSADYQRRLEEVH